MSVTTMDILVSDLGHGTFTPPGHSTPQRFMSPKPSACTLDCPPTPDRTPPPNSWSRAPRVPKHCHSLSLALGASPECKPSFQRGTPADIPVLFVQKPRTPLTPCCNRIPIGPDFLSPMRFPEEGDTVRNPFSPTPCSERSHISSIGGGSATGSDERIALYRQVLFPKLSQSARLMEDFEDLISIGQGESSEVYKARSRLTGLTYAVKVKKNRIRGLKERENQLQEVYALSSGYHPHIIRFHYSWIEEDFLYVVTEFCDGGSVSKEAWSEGAPARDWSEADLLLLLHHVSDALAFLHAHNIAHMDLKMDNVFISKDAAGQRIYKLGDFGLVRMIDGDTSTFDGLNDSEGDSRYMDSYLLNHSDRLREADIFSLGASVYELAQKKMLPTHGVEWSALRQGNPDLSPLRHFSDTFLQMLRRMLHPDPDHRPSAFEIYQYTSHAMAASGNELHTEVDLMKKEAELLKSQLQTLKNLLAAEERNRQRSPDGLAAQRCLSDLLQYS